LTSSKLESLTILSWLSERQSSEVILERILPFFLHHLAAGSPPAVRHAAIDALVGAVGHVKYVPRAEVNTFPEYILPALLPLCNDPSVRVRAALARRLAEIAELAVHFLDLVALGGGGSGSSGEESVAMTTTPLSPLPAASDICSYDTEVTALHDMLSQAVTLLLEDLVNSVKQILVHYGAARLAVFFGRQRANDVLLSHMITFLNDKTDAQLRYTFFDNIAGVAAFVGWQCSPILKPLLQQGLADSEEFVVARAINSIAALARQGLLEKVAMFELLRDTLPFLLHPNLWIRQAAVGLVEAMGARLDTVDIQVTNIHFSVFIVNLSAQVH
jgi:phosphoinositide-3-kinase regulatory subunit 4